MRRAGPIETVTVLVDDLGGATELYRRGIGLQAQAERCLPTALAAALPVLAGCRSALLAAPGDNRPGVLRAVEVPGIHAPRPLTTIGWAAAELIVADVDAAAERARAAGLTVLADPAPVGAGVGLRAVQVGGPAGEALYLTQVDRAPGGFELPNALAPVGRIFIAVLASRDLETSRALLEQLLGARRVTDHELAVRPLNLCMGLPPDTRHRVSSLQLAGDSAVELDQYPAGALPPAGGTPRTGGIVCVSIRCEGGPAMTTIPGTDGALVELVG